MIAVRITQTTLLSLAAQPLGWLGFAALLAIWPALTFAAPLDMMGSSTLDQAWFYELAFIGMLVGSMLGTSAVQGLSPTISFASSGSSLASEMLTLAFIGFLFGLTATLPAILLGGLHPQLLSSGFLFRLSFGLASVSTLGCVLLRLHLPVGVLPWILCVSILLAPLVLPHPVPTRSLATVAAALLSAAWLLDHPPGRTS